eukprot:10120353-Ditylum_brightwellii.AAC.1
MSTIREGRGGLDESFVAVAPSRRTSLVTRGHYDPPLPVHVDGKFYGTLDEALSACEDILLRKRTPGIEQSFAQSLKLMKKNINEQSIGTNEAILALNHYLCVESE